MNKNLALVALRLGGIYVEAPVDVSKDGPALLRLSTINCLSQLFERGFFLTEDALRQFNLLSPEDQAAIIEVMNDVYNLDMNWTPLVRGWNEPTGESAIDHLLTAFANILSEEGFEVKGTRLACGHLIPDGTFDLSRYTGCPFCGRPFELHPGFTFLGQASARRELTLFTRADLEKRLADIIGANALLDATYRDILDILVSEFPLPDPMPEIPVKENIMIVAKAIMMRYGLSALRKYITTPAELLRFVWYIKTGNLRVIRPQTMINGKMRSIGSCRTYHDFILAKELAQQEIDKDKENWKLKFSRTDCRFVADLLNKCNLSVAEMCVQMNPFREMWVRLIRAFRLTEFARHKGYGKLRELLDKFYRKDYHTAEGEVNRALAAGDIDEAVAILKACPGLFARRLFSLMLRYDADNIIREFNTVAHLIPMRMLINLVKNARDYFDCSKYKREVRIITGETVQIPLNEHVAHLDEAQCEKMKSLVESSVLIFLRAKYAENPEPGRKIYIDPELDTMVFPLFSRSDMIQDVMAVPPGTKLKVEGDKVRVFLHWGKNMPAQAIDLDLSVAILTLRELAAYCAFFSLDTPGAKHSGDMRMIPDKVGTAEYIELNLRKLHKSGARKVLFYASNYTKGAIRSNAMVGWMTTDKPMTVDGSTGVAYDPSTVQFMLKIPDEMLAKGLFFGVLDIESREITYIEAQCDGKTISDVSDEFSFEGLVALCEAYKNSLSIGDALRMLADARGMTVLSELPSDPEQISEVTVYDRAWALDQTLVRSLLIPD